VSHDQFEIDSYEHCGAGGYDVTDGAAGSGQRAAGSGQTIWLEGFGEVDRVSVGIQDVGYALPPGHVIRRAEDSAAEDLDVF
jgi:hypothetical protein